MKGSEVVSKAKGLLQREKFFYYNIIKQFRVLESDQIETAGVCWLKDKMYFIYNPTFAAYYSPREFFPIVEHEVDHFIFDHVKNFKGEETKKVFKDQEEAKEAFRDNAMKQLDHKLQNIAMDRSINIYLPNLPNIRMLRGEEQPTEDKKEKGNSGAAKADDNIVGVYRKGNTPAEDVVEYECITEESFKKLLQKSGYAGDVNQVAKFEKWEYYYDLLKSCPDIEEQAKAIKEMDVHFDSGGDGNEGGAEGITKEAFGSMIQEAFENTDNGQVPGHLRSHVENAINGLRQEPLPWHVLLRKHLNKAKKTIMKEDINVRNSYYGTDRVILNSYIDEPLLQVGIIFDVSGSCFSEDIQEMFWGEVEGLRRAGACITIYYTDYDVEHVQVIKPRRKLTPDNYEGKGGGGTDLDKGIIRSINDKNNIHVMLSDNWMNFNLTREDLKGNKVICACNTNAKMPDHYGPTIHINE